MSSETNDLAGYRGLARARLVRSGACGCGATCAWSTTAGSVFEGVILPRSENFDDLHIVLKLKTGYNVGIHIDRVA